MKKQLLTKMLLAIVLLGVGSSAWATPTVIKSWDFVAISDGLSEPTTAGASYSAGSTVTVSNTSCDVLNGNLDGLALQEAGKWNLHMNNSKGVYSYKGLRQAASGGRLLVVMNLKAGDVVTMTSEGGLPTSATNGTYDSENSTEGTNCIYTVVADGHLAVSCTKNNTYKTVSVTRDLADLEDPTYEITGVDGTQRQVTLSCLTDGATIKYNTVDDKAADGWTTYSSPFLTSEATLYAYSEKSSNTSDVITITTGAGTAIKLNAPTYSKTYTDGTYTVNLYSSQGDLEVVPASVNIKYSIDGGSEQTYSTPLALTGDHTLIAHIESAGYTNSDNMTGSTATRPAYGTSWKQDYTQVTSAAGTGVQSITLSSESFTVNGTNFYNIESYGDTPTAVELNTNVGLNTPTGFGLRCNGNNSGILRNSGGTGYIGIKNLKAGEYIVLTTNGNTVGENYGATLQEGMCTGSEFYFLATGTEASISVPAGTYNYVKTISVLAPPVSKPITAAGWATYCSPYALDLANATGLDDAYIVTGGDAGVLSKTSVKGGTVPANTGLLLKGEAGTVTIPVVASSSTDVSANILTGVTSNTVIAAEAGWVLMGSPSLGFYQNSGEFTVGANTAYIPVAKLAVPAGARPFFSLDGDATGISAALMNKETMNNEVYNLKGQRVSQPTKGLYIVNGKKVVIK